MIKILDSESGDDDGRNTEKSCRTSLDDLPEKWWQLGWRKENLREELKLKPIICK